MKSIPDKGHGSLAEIKKQIYRTDTYSDSV